MVMFYYSLVVAEMCTASALISIGTILGKTNPVHLVLIALLEVTGFVLNNWLLQTLLKVSKPLRDPGQACSHDVQRLLCSHFSLFESLDYSSGFCLFF